MGVLHGVGDHTEPTVHLGGPVVVAIGPVHRQVVCAVGLRPRPGGSIDAEPFVDRNGQAYLLWKSEGIPFVAWSRLWSRPLSGDGLSFLPGSSPRLLLENPSGWEGHVLENPSMAFYDGAYWLTYSANEWTSPNYRTGQARCASPSGPCQRSSPNPLIDNTSTTLGAAGASMFTDASGRLRIAYGAWNAPYSSYPANPNCDGPGLCISQGQRFLHIDGLVPWAGQLTVDPIGMLDVAAPGPGAVTVAGWALDPSDPQSIGVHVSIDGTSVPLTASGDRGDVAAAFPGLGSAHGFNATLPAGPGAHQVCVYGINTGAGSNALIGCRTVTVRSGPPIGTLDVAAGVPGGVFVAGWAVDPDTSSPIPVHVYVDGQGVALTADVQRNDVAGVFPGSGSLHGFGATIPAGPGNHVVCAYAINVGVGSNALLDCRLVAVPGGPPFGAIDIAEGVPGGVAVAGWAIDPDTAAPIPVHVYIDSAGTALTASQPRPDVASVFPPYGANHGYSATIPAPGGQHVACAYAINVGAGSNALIGCRLVQVPDTSPFGALDLVAPAPGGVAVAGWAIDPDTAQPIDVHIYVDGQGFALTADQQRPDVGNAYPDAGPAHGFDASIPASPGTHNVCAYAINVAGGANHLLGCRTTPTG